MHILYTIFYILWIYFWFCISIYILVLLAAGLCCIYSAFSREEKRLE